MRIFISLISFLFYQHVISQSITAKQYITQYKSIAIKEMERTGIPASITLAQGMLESGNGNSLLAKKAKNHFGIKCHEWKGEKVYHDDDEKGECFRKYKTAYASYIDHSDFLTNVGRYSFLFELKSTDYKAWAKGLKKAGYATARDYDKKLIRIIEEHKLYEFDIEIVKPHKTINLDKISKSGEYNIKVRNNIKYVIAKQGDTYQSLTNQFDMMKWQLARYNEMQQDKKIKPGDIIYLQPKRKKAERGNKFHIVKEGETMYEISQHYGVKLNDLYKKNLMLPDEEPKPGEKLNLRKAKKGQMPKEELVEKEKEDKGKREERKEKERKKQVKNQQQLEFIFE